MEQDTGYSSRERVKRAIEHCETDKIPKGELVIDDNVVAKNLQCSQVRFNEKLKFVKKLGLDIICISPQHPPLDGNLPDVRDFVFPDLKNWVLKTDLFTFAIIDGVFDWGIKLLGFSQFITLHKRSSIDFMDFTKKIEELNLKLAAFLIDSGIDGIIIADDIAYNRGLLISPMDIRKYIFPSLTLQVEKISSQGLPVFFHSDGNFNDIIPDLVEIGIKGLHCIDSYANMDIFNIQALYGKQLCLWGSLSVENTIHANDAKYLHELKKAILSLAAQKGFILGTNCGIFSGLNLNGLINIYECF
ncbi:uroporphyrinogen decarboxylase family protein [Desulfolucanica intricata]|uniref:uroporphyrinogen decarboxylase family protein n=1 Tax=Desulfolucanica intricata TaxID=1285191 RepID=UPI00082DDCF8|nr:uroporphyrinogen decarboxylase family protein [Desulfolucanica intricata]